MAKFKAAPYYSVHYKAGKINFDHTGTYETTDEGEIAVLNGLCPRYLICVDEPKAEVKQEPKAEEKPAAKTKAPAKKPSAK